MTHETFQYGKFITRMKTENRNGLLQSFALYWTGPNWTDGTRNDIDIAEIIPSMQIKG